MTPMDYAKRKGVQAAAVPLTFHRRASRPGLFLPLRAATCFIPFQT